MKRIVKILGIILGVGIFLILLWGNGLIIPNQLAANSYEVKGIDVSNYQGEIDWKTIEEQDITFAFMKATEGKSYQDPYFLQNYQNAKQTNLILGAYHFYRFDSSPSEQANNYITTVGNLEEDEFMFPIVDFEFYGETRKEKPDIAQTKENLKTYLTQIENYYQIKPIIYATMETYQLYLQNDFQEYDIWIRNIWTKPNLNDRNWTFWQYTNRGKLDGYSGDEKFIDLNVFSGTKEDFGIYLLNKKQERKQNIEEAKQKQLEEEKKKPKDYYGMVTDVEGNTLKVQIEEVGNVKVTLNDEVEIINTRTKEKMQQNQIKKEDKIMLDQVILEEETLSLTQTTNIEVIRKLQGEELKQEILNQEEMAVEIEKIEEKKNHILLTGIIRDLYYTNDYQTAQKFEIQIIVNENTQILGTKENQLEQLKEIQNNTTFIRLNQEEKNKGKLVAENIEVMGC